MPSDHSIHGRHGGSVWPQEAEPGITPGISHQTGFYGAPHPHQEDVMREKQGHPSDYACGDGGFSSREQPLPVVCPTAYPLLWEKSRPHRPYLPFRRPLWGNLETPEA